MNEIIEYLQLLLLGAIAYLVITKKGKPRLSRKNKIILDSCALIDGRILGIVETGFVRQTLIIPKFIVLELQTIADGKNTEKRARARYGLDVANDLQKNKSIEARIVENDYGDIKETDSKLVRLAKDLGADLYTTDYNLNKAASVESVRVLNVNELAGALRPTALPGETKEVKIIQRGSSRDQGVGYLGDGTMVVVEGGIKLMNKKVRVEITKIHQSDAGKMMFAKINRRR